jgi:hypothetical protein
MNILIVSAACCYPGMAVFDEQAKKIIEQAANELGIKAEVKIIPGATAIYGGVVPRPVLNKLMSRFSRNETGPAVVINDEIVAYGVPQSEEIKTVLKTFMES